MILLFGGAAETHDLARALLDAGKDVLLSTVSDAPLSLPAHPRLHRRTGPLDTEGLAALIQEESITYVVDGAHPYALAAHRTVTEACAVTRTPCIALRRPPTPSTSPLVEEVADHPAAATRACEIAAARDGTILLTIGTRTIAVYVTAARSAGVPLHARILDHPASLEAARSAGLSPNEWTTGRGPFSRDETLELIRRTKAVVLVTKDGGREGGVPQKLAAAEAASCTVLLIQRPSLPAIPSASTVDEVLQRMR